MNNFYSIKEALEFLNKRNQNFKLNLHDLMSLIKTHNIEPCFYYNGYIGRAKINAPLKLYHQFIDCHHFSGYLTSDKLSTFIPQNVKNKIPVSVVDIASLLDGEKNHKLLELEDFDENRSNLLLFIPPKGFLVNGERPLNSSTFPSLTNEFLNSESKINKINYNEILIKGTDLEKIIISNTQEGIHSDLELNPDRPKYDELLVVIGALLALTMKPKDSEKKSIHEKQPLYKQNFISEQINTHWLPYQNNIIDALIDEFTNTKYISRGSLIKVFPEANKAFLKELNQKI